ncbi:hypothetical protein J4E91_004717 [Alternaria rosae]|nr:hypothetical protein J4E91_004717 [Alternaria rosae]
MTTASSKVEATKEHDEDVDEALEDLDDWNTYWDSSERDPEGSRTGRQLLLDHVQQLHAHEASTARQTKVPDEANASAVPPCSHDDDQDTCSSSEFDDSDGGIDVGSDNEYEDDESETQYIPKGISENHGLDLQIADELWDLAGGNEEPSDHSADNAEDNELSDESDESDGSEIISPRSPQSYESDDEDESKSTMDGVSFHASSPVTASPVAPAFAFTFKPSQCKVVIPTVPSSSFDPGNWTGAFDFKPPLDDEIIVNGSLLAGNDGASQTSKVPDPGNHKHIGEVGADSGLEPTTSSTVDGNVVATVSDDHSSRIRELTVAINACEAKWLSADAGDCAPSAFVELAKDFDGIGSKIAKERDFSSPSAWNKIEALFTKWQAFVDIMKTFIGVKEYFHPDHEFRFERLVKLYCSDVEMVFTYETLSRLPGAQEYWQNEANKRRESRDDNLKIINHGIPRMFGLRQAYRSELETVNGHIDNEVFKEFGKITLNLVHERILEVNAALRLPSL